MSYLKRFSFIYIVLVVTLVVMVLISGYFYILGGKDQVLKPYQLKATSIFSKIQKTSDITDFFDELKLAGLKGQKVSGQVVVKTDRSNTEFDLEVTDLVKDGNQTISKDQIKIGLEAFVEVKYKSDPASNGTGFYPDPVIFNPNSYPLRKFTNQPFVVRVQIPADCESGVYEGEIKAKFNGRERVAIPIKLYVYDYSFPQERALKTIAGVDKASIRKYYNLEDEDEFFNSFVKMNLEYGINIFGTDLERPYGISKLQDSDLDFSKSDEHIKEWKEMGLNALYIPGTDSFHVESYGESTFLKYLDQITKHYKDKEWLELAYVYPIDEPRTQSAYERVRELYGKIAEQNPDLRKIITEQVTPDNDAWGDLVGYVDSWIAQGEEYFADLDAIKKRKVKGDETGFYTPGRYSGKYGYKDPKTPTHTIDRAFNDLLWAGLLAFRNGDEFHMLWNTTYWAENDPWKNPQTYRVGTKADKTTNMGNGTGYLYYPGAKLHKYVDGQDARVDKTIPSLRLLAFEEGLNLYEVAVLADFPKKFIPEFSKLTVENAEYQYLNLVEQLYSNFRIEGEEISFSAEEPPSFWQNLKDLFS